MTAPISHITTKAERYILQLFNEKGKTQYLFHDFRRANEIVQLVQDVGSYSGYNEFSSEVEIAKLAAWFSAAAWLEDYTNPHFAGKKIARTFFSHHEYPFSSQTTVLNCISTILQEKKPTSPSEMILHDATLAYWCTSNFMRLSPLMRLEKELVLGEKLTLEEWETQQLNGLVKHKFYTGYGQLIFHPILAQNIIEQKEKLDTILKKAKKRPSSELLRKYQGLEPKIPLRGGQTFFRVLYRNHIQLSSIADNKANILTGINTILISVLVSIITYSSINFKEVSLFMPISLLLLTAMVSLIFSILAASPRVTRNNRKVKDKLKVQKNIAFFGNFSQMSLNDYEEAMDTVLRNDELIYGNMTRDLYFLGKTLDKKYKLLRYSYHVFLVGFLVSILLFAFFIVRAGGI